MRALKHHVLSLVCDGFISCVDKEKKIIFVLRFKWQQQLMSTFRLCVTRSFSEMFTVESQKSHLYNRVNKTDAKNNKIQMILGMFSFFFFWDELLKDNIASLFFF